MSNELAGKRIAFLLTSGVEQVELTTPWQALRDAGADADVEPADTFDADLAVADARVADFDGLVLPGGTTNPDTLRMDEAAVALVKAFAEAGKPVAAICHGPWMLVEAGVLPGKTLTSWPSLRTDVENAGGTWQDSESVTCPKGFPLLTSRNPDDLPAFVEAATAVFAG